MAISVEKVGISGGWGSSREETARKKELVVLVLVLGVEPINRLDLLLNWNLHSQLSRTTY